MVSSSRLVSIVPRSTPPLSTTSVSGLGHRQREGRGQGRRQTPFDRLPPASRLDPKPHGELQSLPAWPGDDDRQCRRRRRGCSVARQAALLGSAATPAVADCGWSALSGAAASMTWVSTPPTRPSGTLTWRGRPAHRYLNNLRPAQRLAAVERGRKPAAGQHVFRRRRWAGLAGLLRGPEQLDIFTVGDKEFLCLVRGERPARCGQRVVLLRIVRHDNRVGRHTT